MYIEKLNINYGDIQIKQCFNFKYLGYSMDKIMPGKAMALNVIHKISKKLKLLYRKNKHRHQH